MPGEAWQPGDPVHPEPTLYGSCGPCLVRWTSPVDICPECGELSTEALRAALAREQRTASGIKEFLVHEQERLRAKLTRIVDGGE